MTRFVLAGAGNVGRRFLQLVGERRGGLDLRPAAVIDSHGALLEPAIDQVVTAKLNRRPIADNGWGVEEVLARVEADLYFDATPTRHDDPAPSIGRVKHALDKGLDCVLATKGPLVHGYGELSSVPGRQLRFSGAVCGAMPTVSVGRELVGAKIRRLEGVLNVTSQIVLGGMAEGMTFEQAIGEAQRLGVAEPDPSLDVDGWDSAAKLVILANAVLGQPSRLSDVEVAGIRGVERGARMSLVASAEPTGDRYRLSVAPRSLPEGHPLARLGAHEMGLTYDSDLHGLITIVSSHQTPMGTAAAMLRDAAELVKLRGR